MTGNKYRGLKGIYYEAVKHRDLESYRKMVDSRRNNELAVHTGLTMAPLVNEFRTSDQFEIFYLPALQISQLEEEIFTLSHQIDKKMALIPEVAQEQIFNNNLVDELQSTNDIEGVKSSKEEISQTFERLKKVKSARNVFLV
ncbi:hypothetical protein [Xylocopilactobacillus apicola]|uniref:Uncharacterized protein n=1 Tax=Xylocopilactobacillus apicola TaxID=2932184 RepID=A0AAU9DM12_9LACO|nr:hypothetical protein [Xylocopilactobacillus apicola]BDR57927.1 hypothetical protein XA3_03680 [Xylocopilactobacillus apicola]